MGKRKLYQYLLICLMIIGIMSNISGCGDGKKDMPADMEQMADDSTKNSSEAVTEAATENTSEVPSETETVGDETTVQATTDGIFYWSSEDYFYLLEGKWRAVEYAGTAKDSHEVIWEEGYWEEHQEYVDKVTKENLGSEYNIIRDNLEYCGPLGGLTIIMEDNTRLFNELRLSPGVGENISMTPPYIGLEIRLADKGERYNFVIDAEGTVLIEIDYCFFRLERIEE